MVLVICCSSDGSNLLAFAVEMTSLPGSNAYWTSSFLFTSADKTTPRQDQCTDLVDQGLHYKTCSIDCTLFIRVQDYLIGHLEVRSELQDSPPREDAEKSISVPDHLEGCKSLSSVLFYSATHCCLGDEI